MEHFKVLFDPNDIRDVLLDGIVVGPTETVLMTTANYYKVTLSGALNYDPPFMNVLITGTTSDRPLILTFKRSGVADV